MDNVIVSFGTHWVVINILRENEIHRQFWSPLLTIVLKIEIKSTNSAPWIDAEVLKAV